MDRVLQLFPLKTSPFLSPVGAEVNRSALPLQVNSKTGPQEENWPQEAGEPWHPVLQAQGKHSEDPHVLCLEAVLRTKRVPTAGGGKIGVEGGERQRRGNEVAGSELDTLRSTGSLIPPGQGGQHILIAGTNFSSSKYLDTDA